MTIEIMTIFKESFKDVREHKMEWVRVATAPVILWLVGILILALAYVSTGLPWISNIIENSMQGTQNFIEKPFSLTLADTIYHIFTFISTICLLINGYRYGFLKEGGDRFWTLKLNWRFVKMCLYYFLVLILTALYVAIAAGISIGIYFLVESVALSTILGVLFTLYGFYLIVRIGLTFFLIAIDRTIPIRISWRLLKGNVLRFLGLMLLIFLTIFLIIIAGCIVLGLFGWLLSLVSPTLLVIPFILLFIFGIILWFISWAVTAKAFALVYKTFTEGEIF